MKFILFALAAFGQNSDPIAEARQQCAAGETWGYYVTKDSPIPSRQQKFEGNFATQDECDQAREKDKSASGLYPKCGTKYHGKTITAELWSAKYKTNWPPSNEIDRVHFSTKELCNEKIKAKLKLEGGIVIDPKGSDGSVTFISSCEKDSFVVCKEGDVNPRRPADYFK